MNKEIEELISMIDKVANELIISRVKHEDLLKSYDAYLETLADLNDKIISKKNVNKTLLDSYKITRATYQLEINKLLSKIVTSEKEIASAKEELSDLTFLKETYAKKLNLIYKIKAIEVSSLNSPENMLEQVKSYSGKEIKILKEEVKNYQALIDSLGLIDIKLCSVFAKVKEKEEIKDINFEESYLVTEPPVDDLETLQKERDNIINAMTSIENMPGKKALFSVKNNGNQIKKQISSRYLAKYKGLYNKLTVLDLEIASLKTNTMRITFDENLYNNMTELQKLAYAANLELQIENSEYVGPVYVDKHTNKKIPVAYKSLYERLLRITNPKKKNNYLESPLSKEYLSKKTLSDQKDYYKALVIQIISSPVSNPVEYSYKGVSVTIDASLMSLFKETIANYEAVMQKAEEELKAVNIKIENIANLLPNEPIKVTSKNKEITIDKNNVVTLSELSSSASNLEELMNDNLNDDIPLDYPKDLDITLDEEYIKTLNQEEQKAYYKLKLHDIELHSTNAAKVLETVDKQPYRYDEQYSGLFHEIVRRYNNILKNEAKPLTVVEKRRPKFLTKIKSELKKKGVQIALGAVALLGVLATNHKNNLNLEENVIEVPSVANIEALSSVDEAKTLEDEKILDIVNTTLENDNKELEEQEVLGQTFRLNEGAKIYHRYYSSEGASPTFKNDLYTTIGVLLETNYGEEIRVDYNTPDCEEIIANVLEQGGKIIKRQAVCASGLQDFLTTGIPTGIVDESTISLVNENSQLKDMIINSLNNGRSR